MADPAYPQGGLLMQVENVHERLREARERHRVMRGNPFAEVRSGHVGDLGVTVLGYDECQTVLTHPDTFSSSIYNQIMGPVMGRTLLELEGAEHRASRALVSPSFRTTLLERWRSELMEVVVHELIDRFAPRGRAELAREFTFAFPVQVIARIMGLPRSDYVRFQRLSIELLNVVYDWDRGIAASASLKTYFTEILAERRRNPRDAPSRRRCAGSRRSPPWCERRSATASLAGSPSHRERTSASASRPPTGTRCATRTRDASTPRGGTSRT